MQIVVHASTPSVHEEPRRSARAVDEDLLWRYLGRRLHQRKDLGVVGGARGKMRPVRPLADAMQQRRGGMRRARVERMLNAASAILAVVKPRKLNVVDLV